MIDFAATNQASLNHLPELLSQILPGGKVQGREYVCGNLAGGSGQSCKVNLDSGKWSDFATDEKGGDPVSLMAAIHGIPQGEAANRLNDHLGITDSQPHHYIQRPSARSVTNQETKPSGWQTLPADTKPPAVIHPQHGTPSAIWEYRDQEDKLLGYICRFDFPDGKKEFRPYTYGTDTITETIGWRWQSWSAPRPLYGLDRMAQNPNSPIIWVEGEKAADAAQRLLPGAIAITSPGGCKATNKADLTPLEDRRVAVFPDNDKPGREAAEAVSVAAIEAGAREVFIVEPPLDKIEGWDLADAETEGWTPAQVSEWIKGNRRKVENPNNVMLDVTDVTDATTNDSKGLVGSTNEQEGVTGVTQKKPNGLGFRVFDATTMVDGKKLRPGVWKFIPKVSGNGEGLNSQWVSSSIHVLAVTCDAQENNFGRLLSIKNTLGTVRKWAMPMDLLKGDGSDMRGVLLNMGAEIDPKSRNDLSVYIQSQRPKRRILSALQVGWQGNSFVLPDKVIGEKAADVVFQSGEMISGDHFTGGTLVGWQEGVAEKAVGNPLLMLSLSASFAGPLLSKTHNKEGGGFHFQGDSSTGKSTMLVAACATWGGESFKRSWKTTANGLEGAAALSNDCLLALDELSECNPKEVGAIIYSLGNGIGKQRATRTGMARNVTRWRCIVISNGEQTIGTTMAAGGEKVKAGQSVRLLDIPVAREFGAFDILHGAMNGSEFSDDIKLAATTHYGHAGREFLERLTRDERNFGELLKRLKSSPGFSPKNAVAQEKRGASRFALAALAGELATEYGLTGWTEGDALNAAVLCFELWRSLRGQGNHENRQIIDQVRCFIERHGDSRFSKIGTDRIVNNRAGYFEDKGEGRIYIFTAAGMNEATNGFELKRALDALLVIGALTPDKNCNSQQKKISGKNTRVYVINPDRLGDDEHGA